MQNPSSTGSEEADQSRSSSSTTPTPSGSNAPLVIVSERGRHSDESRRIVRAQAARASAAQSRVTRARNRGEREGTLREDHVTPPVRESNETLNSPSEEAVGIATTDLLRWPLVPWISTLLNTSVARLMEDAQVRGRSTLTSSPDTLSGGRGVGPAFGTILNPESPTAGYRPQLPLAVPPGITKLLQQVQISDTIVTLTGRTSFFDLDSPGVQERLHQLLFDLILGYTEGSPDLYAASPGHRIQDYLRIACVCLTIFQGQRAGDAAFAYQERYERGLAAAWNEAMLLDQAWLREPKVAELSLWAIFIISVTTGASTTTFLPVLHLLLEDLQLDNWPNVRNVLLDFIFPVSFLDAPCQSFYDSVRQQVTGRP